MRRRPPPGAKGQRWPAGPWLRRRRNCDCLSPRAFNQVFLIIIRVPFMNLFFIILPPAKSQQPELSTIAPPVVKVAQIQHRREAAGVRLRIRSVKVGPVAA